MASGLTIDIQKLWDQKYRDESAPFPVDGTPGAINLDDGAVTTQKIADGAVTTNKIADGTITDADISASAAIEAAKLQAGVDGQVLTSQSGTTIWQSPSGGSPSGTAGGDLAGTYPNPVVAPGSVTAAKMASGTITNAQISASAAIAVTKIAPGADGNVLTMSGSTVTWAAPTGGGGASSGAALRWYDTKDYGAKSDLTKGDLSTVTAANATITGTTFAGASDVGKLIRVQAAGAQLFHGTDGAMSNASASTRNRFTSAGASFDQTCLGRWIIITGQFTARIVGVESSTQLRLATPAGSVFSGATWTINEDHYTTIASSVAATSATLTVAPIQSVTNAIVYYGTDDAPAIQAAVTAAELTTNLGGTGNTVYHEGASMIGTPIYLQKPTALLGSGNRGYSEGQNHGRSRLMLGAPRIRGIVGGGTDTGMGVNGSMTASSGVLTDPGANFQVGDVGKNIIVYGAGTQTGSSLGFFLNTTIASRQSATQVTLTAAAGTTVSGAIYTYASSAGYSGGLVGPSVKNLHVEGGPGQLCGIHLMNASASIVAECVASNFGSGVAMFMDPGPSVGFSNQSEFRSCFANDSRIGFKHDRGSIMFTGNSYVDGNDNRVDCFFPEGMTLGIDANDLHNAGYFKLQAVGTAVRSSGRGGGCEANGADWAFENVGVMFDLASDGGNGGLHHNIGFSTAGNSNAGGGSFGLRLRAGARCKLTRGYHLDNDVDMFSLVDPAAVLSVVGEQIQKSGPVSDGDFFNQPYDGARGFDTSTGDSYIRINGLWRRTATTVVPSMVKKHDEKENLSSGTTRTLTVASKIPVGHFMVVPWIYGSASTQTITVTDSQSNTWSTDVHADKTTSNTPHAGISTARVTTQLNAGDTITITAASSVNLLSGDLFEYVGLASGTRLDQTDGTQTGTGTAVASAAVTTTQATEVLLACVCNADGTTLATQTPGAGWVARADFQNQGTKRLTFLEQVVFATGTYTFTETLSTSNEWAVALATYKSA